MPVSEAKVNGAELVRKLRAAHTPDAKLAPARRVLAITHETEGRVATADEVLAEMEKAFGPDDGTVKKARQIVAVGEYVPPATKSATPIEEVLLGPAKADGRKSVRPEPAGRPTA